MQELSNILDRLTLLAIIAFIAGGVYLTYLQIVDHGFLSRWPLCLMQVIAIGGFLGSLTHRG